jgi:hypothetical protein
MLFIIFHRIDGMTSKIHFMKSINMIKYKNVLLIILLIFFHYNCILILLTYKKFINVNSIF